MSWEGLFKSVLKDIVYAHKNQHQDDPYLLKVASDVAHLIQKTKLIFEVSNDITTARTYIIALQEKYDYLLKILEINNIVSPNLYKFLTTIEDEYVKLKHLYFDKLDKPKTIARPKVNLVLNKAVAEVESSIMEVKRAFLKGETKENLNYLYFQMKQKYEELSVIIKNGADAADIMKDLEWHYNEQVKKFREMH